jgi:hypothetical protein
MVRSQTTNLTPGPSFDHNLCFRCPNGQCEPISDIYVLISLQWYKKLFKTMSFDPNNCALKIWESIGIPIPNMGVNLGVWGFIPSHSFALPGAWNVTPSLPSCPGHKPKARVVTNCKYVIFQTFGFLRFMGPKGRVVGIKIEGQNERASHILMR